MSKEGTSGITRRSFVYGAGGVAVLLGLGGVVKLVKTESILRPPGGQDEASFISLCIRCEKCREACPRSCIIPAGIESGFINARTPTLNFKGYDNDRSCDFCNGDPLCVKACPTNALKLDEGTKFEDIRMGTVELTTDWCITYQNITAMCKSCVDACEFDVMGLEMAVDENGDPVLDVELKEQMYYPIVKNPEKCTGCGKCENVCKSLQVGSLSRTHATNRAIHVITYDAYYASK
jgi:ferredoxin-type protein NapG